MFSLALVLAGTPAAVLARETGMDSDPGLFLRIDGPAYAAKGERIGAAIAIGSNATIDGTVDGRLLVIDGTVTVKGRVEGGATIISGTLVLKDRAVVGHVSFINSELTRPRRGRASAGR